MVELIPFGIEHARDLRALVVRCGEALAATHGGLVDAARSDEAMEEYLAGARSYFARSGGESFGIWIDGQLVGEAGFAAVHDGCIEPGCFLDPAARGQGVMMRVASALGPWLADRGVHTVVGITGRLNTSAQSLCGRIGMRSVDDVIGAARDVDDTDAVIFRRKLVADERSLIDDVHVRD